MKTKKPRSHIFDLTPDARIKEIDKVLKKLERLPRTPEIMKHMAGIQFAKARLITGMSNNQ